MKTEWDLTLLYKSIDDPQIEKDIKHTEKMCDAFSRTYSKVNFSKSVSNVLKALVDFETLHRDGSAEKPICFLRYTIHIGRDEDGSVQAKMNKVQERVRKSLNKIKFFILALGSIQKKQQKVLLSHPTLKPYKHFLSEVFKTAQFQLSEEVEKVLSLTRSVAYDAWTSGQSKLLSQQMVTYNGRTVPIEEITNSLLKEPNKESRSKMQEALTGTLKNISPFAESELNAIFAFRKIEDELRSLKHPSDAMLLENQDSRKAVDNLIKTVTDNFNISHTYYGMLAKELGLAELGYEDRQASVGTLNKSFSFEESIDILKDAFRPLGQVYVDLVDSFVKRGQVDVYPRKGKRGGAYCSSMYGSETYVLLNHVNNFTSLQTFGHEMGHAFHSHFSRTQSALNFDYSLTTAETASTFFENVVFEHVLKQLSAKERKIALFDRLQRDISTIFRQVACYNFESELHQTVRTDGFVSKENIAQIHNKNMSAYLGPKMKFREDDGYMFVSWPHLRYYFYVYTYAYGLLTSKVMLRNLEKDPGYIKQVEKFLKAGGSDTPINIFKSIGIDTTKPDFFRAGLLEIEKDIRDLKSL